MLQNSRRPAGQGREPPGLAEIQSNSANDEYDVCESLFVGRGGILRPEIAISAENRLGLPRGVVQARRWDESACRRVDSPSHSLLSYVGGSECSTEQMDSRQTEVGLESPEDLGIRRV